jgi:hypothetical protein
MDWNQRYNLTAVKIKYAIHKPPYDDTCLLPFLAKYLAYAHIDHPSDKEVDDMFETALEVAKIAEKEFPELCDNKPAVNNPKYFSSHNMYNHDKAGFDLCEIAKHPASTRIDKVVAIETVASARHNSGVFFDHLCATSPAGAALADTILEMLSE